MANKQLFSLILVGSLFMAPSFNNPVLAAKTPYSKTLHNPLSLQLTVEKQSCIKPLPNGKDKKNCPPTPMSTILNTNIFNTSPVGNSPPSITNTLPSFDGKLIQTITSEVHKNSNDPKHFTVSDFSF